jgi:hypothetical protein
MNKKMIHPKMDEKKKPMNVKYAKKPYTPEKKHRCAVVSL